MPMQYFSFAGSFDAATLGMSSLNEVWVKLKALPSAYSYSEAMLLCQVADEEWLAWVPDFGEICLTTAQFVVD